MLRYLQYITCMMMLVFFDISAQTLVITYQKIEKYPPEMLKDMPGLVTNDVLYYTSLRTDGKNSLSVLDSVVINSFMAEGKQTFIRCFLYKDYLSDRSYESWAQFSEGQAVINIYSDQWIRSEDWKWTDRTRKILDIPCLLAQHKVNGTQVWYAPNIPYPDGPDPSTWGFPGLVLAVDRIDCAYSASRIEYQDEPVEIPDFEQVSNNRIPNSMIYRDLSNLPPNDYLILNALQPKNVALTFDD